MGEALGREGLLLLAHPERHHPARATAMGPTHRRQKQIRRRQKRSLVQHLRRRLRRDGASVVAAVVDVDDEGDDVDVEELHLVVDRRPLQGPRSVRTQAPEFAAVEKRRRNVEDDAGEC